MTEPSPNGLYQIVLRGRIPNRMLAPYIDEFDVDRTDTTTILTGTIVDPSQLHGLITHLTSTGVEIIELASGHPIDCTVQSSQSRWSAR